jgi:hypothetical protein
MGGGIDLVTCAHGAGNVLLKSSNLGGNTVADDLGTVVGTAVGSDANVLFAPGSDSGDAMANDDDSATDLLKGGSHNRPEDDDNGDRETNGGGVLAGFCESGGASLGAGGPEGPHGAEGHDPGRSASMYDGFNVEDLCSRQDQLGRDCTGNDEGDLVKAGSSSRRGNLGDLDGFSGWQWPERHGSNTLDACDCDAIGSELAQAPAARTTAEHAATTTWTRR